MTRPLAALLYAFPAALGLFVTGCGLIGGGDSDPTPTPAATQPFAVAPTQASLPTETPAPTASPTPAAPSTYVVEAGDNPTLIAEKLGVPEADIDAWVAEMLALNDTEATALQIGQELVLPPIGGAAAVATTPAEGQATNTPQAGGTPDATATQPPAVTTTESSTTSQTTAAATATASPTPTVSTGGFGDGILTVGTQVAPGTYRTRQANAFCYWARLSGLSGSDNDIIANSVDENGFSVVTIEASDLAFESDGCGTWSTDLSAVTSNPQAAFSDGTYIVGTDIAPGTWTSTSATETCYWEVTRGFHATLDDVVTNGIEGGPIEIQAGDTGFYTSGCGTWQFEG